MDEVGDVGRDFRVLPGQNCWRVGEAERACFLIDGAEYFSDLHASFLQARKRIFILGWDLLSGIKLVPESSAQGWPSHLAPLLRRLVDSNPELNVYLLVWDAFPFFYQFRERNSHLRHQFSHPRIHLCLNRLLPTFASFHQKLVVIDDTVAYCGGIDLTENRLDNRRHSVRRSKRSTSEHGEFLPIHDIQLRVEGVIAKELAMLACEDWRQVTGSDPCHPSTPILRLVEPVPCGGFDLIGRQRFARHELGGQELNDVPIAISRTRAFSRTTCAVREIERLFIDLILQAQNTIYIECQYLSSVAVTDALKKTLSRSQGPEIVIISSRVYEGWWECRTLGALRNRRIMELKSADANGRLGVFYPSLPGFEKGINVHSKLVLIDDAFACIGSPNLTNRSLHFDSECMLTIDARQNGEARTALRELRANLLSEHLGLREREILRLLERTGSMLEVIRETQSRPRTLRPLPLIEEDWYSWFLVNRKWSDPDSGLRLEEKLYRWLEGCQTRLLRPGFDRGLVNWRFLITVVFFSLILWLIVSKAHTIDWQEVFASVRTYNAQTLLVAGFIALLSYSIFVMYDLLAKRYSGHSVSRSRVLAISFVSYAFNLSLGSLIGGFAFRFRLYSRFGLEPLMISRILGFAILTNWLGYTLIAGLVFLFLPPQLPGNWRLGANALIGIGFVLVCLTGGYIALCAVRPSREWRLHRFRWRVPTLRIALTQVFISAINWLLIGAILFWLLRSESLSEVAIGSADISNAGIPNVQVPNAEITYVEILGIYLISAVAAVLTHIPAGLGVLEAVFLTMLDGRMPTARILAALLVYRAIYFLAPLAIAAVVYFILEVQAFALKRGRREAQQVS